MSGTRLHLQAVPPSAFGADQGIPHVKGVEGVEVDIETMAHNWTGRKEEGGQEGLEIAGSVKALDRFVY